jgi:hypothetical protein
VHSVPALLIFGSSGIVDEDTTHQACATAFRIAESHSHSRSGTRRKRRSLRVALTDRDPRCATATPETRRRLSASEQRVKDDCSESDQDGRGDRHSATDCAIVGDTLRFPCGPSLIEAG